MEKGENAGDQHFLLFPQSFQKASSVKSLDLWKELNLMTIIDKTVLNYVNVRMNHALVLGGLKPLNHLHEALY